MDRLQKLSREIRGGIFWIVLLENVLLVGGLYVGHRFSTIPLDTLFLYAALVGLLLIGCTSFALTRYTLSPLQAIWKALIQLTPGDHAVMAPNVSTLRVGRELVATLVAEVYQLTSRPSADPPTGSHNQGQMIANNLPLPLLILNADQNIVFINDAAAQYLSHTTHELVGQNIYSVLDMAFPSEQTFDVWLKDVTKTVATATHTWERVRLNASDSHPVRYFDLAAYYNQGNVDSFETMMVFFDHTAQYSQDDQAISFIALSVHELRTPLTLLRGYIEVFEEEIGPTLNPEFKDFMFKMNATAQQLSAFVNNILNVARVDDDQLILALHEETWPTIVKSAANMMALRANVRGITIEYSIAPDLPTVGADRVSIQEVITNLIDNAIKYSGTSKRIRVSTFLNNEGMVETDVQDSGSGIATNLLPNLFTKFYRDHHNRAQIGGTGLGLYLSKAIVTAHGGNIWVRSKEGEGSTFSFTLSPYAALAETLKTSDNKEIVRDAHGWIKNHSFYRR
jgi:signal transduction histidine kinase